MFKSIRSRLALSFASIALIAAVVLGAVLLAILQRYYQDLELNYLRGNAQTISSLVTKMMSGNATHDEVQSQIENLAFLIQTRVQVYSPEKQLLYDSGPAQNVDVNLGAAKQLLAESNGALPDQSLRIISVVPQGNTKVAPARLTPDGSVPEPNSKGVFIYRSVQVSGSPFGFAFGAEAAPAGAARSNLKITQLLRDPQNAGGLGFVELSDGPAYGSAILMSVAQGWGIASAIAVLLAALIGWYISRRISAPVLALTAVTARMAKGDLAGRANVSGRDELGQLANSFNEMADQVEKTVTTLRRFVSDAAHELRTPLTALRTNLDLALDEKDTADRTVYVSRAQGMVRRLEELDTNLLDLSRLEATATAKSEDIIDLTKLLLTRTELYASQAEQSRVTYVAELPAIPIHIRADASQITRAMDNLVDNACKFTPQEGTVQIALSQENGQAIFSVTDTGIGIPGDDLPQLFNRFHRGRNTMAFQGSGLGLAIVNAIVSGHAGRVEVQSAGEGKGSKFSFRLPIVPVEDL